MLQTCDILAIGRRTIVSMPECTAFQVEIVFNNRMLKEISISCVFVRTLSSSRLVCQYLRVNWQLPSTGQSG
jgi:hypothetical protein